MVVAYFQVSFQLEFTMEANTMNPDQESNKITPTALYFTVETCE